MAPSSATSTSTPSMSPAKSTPPSSVGADSPVEVKDENTEDSMVSEKNKMDEAEQEDDEALDYKSNALHNLLKTSNVFVAIMADKMKEQQKQAQEAAKRAAAKKKIAEAKEQDSKGPTRKSARVQADEPEPAPPNNNKNSAPTTEKKPRGRPKKSAAAKKTIADFFQKSDTIEISRGGPTVQEALAEAADEYEGEGLGSQDLAATEQPTNVTGGTMKHYQLEGLEWLKTLWMNGLSGILADEMGLGKTLQTISLIAFFKENNIPGPFLIAAPVSTVRNWIEEFKFWTPSIKTILYHGTPAERAEMRRKSMKPSNQALPDFPVVVTGYEMCMKDKKFFQAYQWKYIVVDEGHRLKNMNCKLIKDLMTFNSANRLLITGTPLQNNIAELWSLLHFLLPEVFNDLDSFERWFDFSSVLESKDADGKATKRKINLVSTMHSILKPFLLRRVKTDVESSLPKKREYILYAPLSDEQKDLYREILAGTVRGHLEQKAVERIEARSRPVSLKRKANGSGRSTPVKSLKSSRAATPASVASVDTVRRGRKSARTNYAEISDREFNARLRLIEQGENDIDLDRATPADSDELDSAEEEEIQRAENLKLAKKEIASKKLQNPIMQARLACNSPHSFYWPWAPTTVEEEKTGNYPGVDESLVTASGKILLLDTLLPRLFKLGHKVLIFSQFKSTLDILEVYASTLRNWSACRIDGSIAQEERYQQITAFNKNKKHNLFLLSTRAGGQGINLTAADTVVLFDSDWNPQQDLQAMDRAHRIGQTKPVIVYRLATRGTVEETLLSKADGKRKLEKLVIQKGKFKSLLADASEEDVRGVLGSDEFENYDIAHPHGQDGKGEILSEAELSILTDRSDAAYERAEKGLDVGGEGTAFKVAETKRGGAEDVLADLTVRSGN